MDELALRQGIDRIEIHELMNRYAHAIDFGDFGRLGQVFTDDAVADFSSMGEYVDIDSVLHGRAAIVSYYEVALAPFEGFWSWCGSCTFGPIDLTLARLALAVGDRERAGRLAASAIESGAALRASRFVAASTEALRAATT